MVEVVGWNNRYVIILRLTNFRTHEQGRKRFFLLLQLLNHDLHRLAIGWKVIGIAGQDIQAALPNTVDLFGRNFCLFCRGASHQKFFGKDYLGNWSVREGVEHLTWSVWLDKLFLHPLGPYWYLHTLLICGLTYFAVFRLLARKASRTSD